MAVARRPPRRRLEHAALEQRRYTIDASVFVNAFNPHEEGHTESLAALTAIQERGDPVIVPTLLLPEIAAAVARASDDSDDGEGAQPRLHAVTLNPGAHAIGKTFDDLRLAELGLQVKAVRRPGAAKRLAPQEVGALEQGDVVLLLGVPDLLAAAEIRLLQG